MTTPSPSAFDPRAFEGTAEYYAVGRHLLHEYSPDGLFWDWPGDTELVIATKS
jgi:hypothetical protein